MKYVIISGSQRSNSESRRVSDYLAARLKERYEAGSYILDLASQPVPMWEESVFDFTQMWETKWRPHAQQIEAADALIWVVPEWNGMFPSGIANLLQLCNPQLVGHKPALIASVSAARGGSYVISQMRMNTTKNNRMLYIPEHLILRNVGEILHGAEAQNEEDGFMRTRIDFALDTLSSYAKALAPCREQLVSAIDQHKNGM